MKSDFSIEKAKPVYDEQGNIKYYEDDEYVYVKHNGEFINNI